MTERAAMAPFLAALIEPRGELAEVFETLREAIGIVRAFSDGGPPIYESDYGGPRCTLCEGLEDHRVGDVDHDVDCLWRRAREWTEKHPEPAAVT